MRVVKKMEDEKNNIIVLICILFFDIPRGASPNIIVLLRITMSTQRLFI